MIMQKPSTRLIISILLDRVADLEYVIYILNRVGYVKYILYIFFLFLYYLLIYLINVDYKVD